MASRTFHTLPSRASYCTTQNTLSDADGMQQLNIHNGGDFKSLSTLSWVSGVVRREAEALRFDDPYVVSPPSYPSFMTLAGAGERGCRKASSCGDLGTKGSLGGVQGGADGSARKTCQGA